MTGMDGDSALVARLKAADGDAFDELFARFHPRLFNFLARLSRRRDVAEDLLEETWLRVVAHAPRLRPDTCLAPWLFTIARNLFASYCRSRQVDYEAAVGIHLWPVPAPSPSPFEAAAAGQLQKRIEVALATLPGTYREALLLVALEGMTPSEAAVVCGVSPDAMRQRLSRARALLADRLEGAASVRVARLGEVWP
ncbi:MAG TPA: RNA polymerase sigma factor [Vicinamibacterales bacterium]|nr:RNA polymerase sigma factor [Vicinamibacterales bacterium]